VRARAAISWLWLIATWVWPLSVSVMVSAAITVDSISTMTSAIPRSDPFRE
jgi:hypothetical protein